MIKISPDYRREQWAAIHAAAESVGKGVCGIYRFTCIETGAVYVGQAKDISNRIKQHCRDAACLHVASTAFHKEIAKRGGVSAFKVEVIEVLPKDRMILSERENHWLAFHGAGTSTSCLNTHPRSGLSPLGSKPPEIIYHRIAIKLRGRPRPDWVIEKIRATKLSPEGRARNSAANKGRKHTPEALASYKATQQRPDLRALSSARFKGKKLSLSHVAKLKAFQNLPDQIEKTIRRMKGVPRSAEQREKIRDTLTGVPHTLERRKNQSDARKRFIARCGSPWKGRKHTEESRAKMRISRLKYFERIAQSKTAA